MSKWREYSASADGREEYRKWEEYRMRFENSTPQQAAIETACNAAFEEYKAHVDVINWDAAIDRAIQTAARLAYERGKEDVRPKYAVMHPSVADMSPVDAFYTGWLAAEDQIRQQGEEDENA